MAYRKSLKSRLNKSFKTELLELSVFGVSEYYHLEQPGLFVGHVTKKTKN